MRAGIEHGVLISTSGKHATHKQSEPKYARRAFRLKISGPTATPVAQLFPLSLITADAEALDGAIRPHNFVGTVQTSCFLRFPMSNGAPLASNPGEGDSKYEESRARRPAQGLKFESLRFALHKSCRNPECAAHCSPTSSSPPFGHEM